MAGDIAATVATAVVVRYVVYLVEEKMHAFHP
jgi:hypothetical protein